MDNPDTTTTSETTAPLRRLRRRFWRWGKLTTLVFMLGLGYGLMGVWQDAPRAEWLKKTCRNSLHTHGTEVLSPTALFIRKNVAWCRKLPIPFAKPAIKVADAWVLTPLVDQFLVTHEITYWSGESLTEAEWGFLSRSRSVRSLSLPHVSLEGMELKYLRRMTWLRKLECHQPLEAAQLTTLLSDMSQLEELTLFARSFDADLSRTLGRKNRLKRLTLQAPLGENADQIFTKTSTPKLEALSLLGPTTGDGQQVLHVWLQNRKLVYLGLSNLSVTPQHMEDIANLSHLQTLDLPACRIPPKAFPSLARCSQLSQLNLMNTNVDDSIIPSLNQLTTLTHLNLKGTRITVEGAEKLRLRATLQLDPYQDPKVKTAKLLRPAITTNMSLSYQFANTLINAGTALSPRAKEILPEQMRAEAESLKRVAAYQDKLAAKQHLP